MTRSLIRPVGAPDILPMQSELNRMLNAMFDMDTAGITRRWMPAVDLVEREDAYTLNMDVPGMTREDLEIEVIGRSVVVTGSRSSEQEEQGDAWRHAERSFGTFSRSLELPFDIDPSTVNARVANGELCITIAKPAREAVGTRIDVESDV